jgi:hypothetical protein
LRLTKRFVVVISRKDRGDPIAESAIGKRQRGLGPGTVHDRGRVSEVDPANRLNVSVPPKMHTPLG